MFLLQYPTQPIIDALAAFFQAAFYPGGFAEFIRSLYELLYCCY